MEAVRALSAAACEERVVAMALAAELASVERGAAAAAAAASSAVAEMRLVADTAGEVATLREKVLPIYPHISPYLSRSPHISPYLPTARPYLPHISPIGCDAARGGISLHLAHISPISPP